MMSHSPAKKKLPMQLMSSPTDTGSCPEHYDFVSACVSLISMEFIKFTVCMSVNVPV